MNPLVSKFLDFLGLEKSEPDLPFLNRLIEQHQKKVKWETLTKIIDWENGNRTGNFLPSIDVYIDRIVQLGAGGTCWTLARGFHWLLTELGYAVHYLYMDSGHLCLRVDLDQPYYVDVGYCAPLFQAYPMVQSFKVQDNREVFDYQYTEPNIIITRTPGPTKTLNPNPIQLESMEPLIKRSNDWQTSPVLKDILIFTYVDDVPTSINNLVVKQYFPNEKLEKTLTDEEMESFLTEKLGINQPLYKEALSIYRQKHNIDK
jgi:arylamine N-acetyltransferase